MAKTTMNAILFRVTISVYLSGYVMYMNLSIAMNIVLSKLPVDNALSMTTVIRQKIRNPSMSPLYTFKRMIHCSTSPVTPIPR